MKGGVVTPLPVIFFFVIAGTLAHIRTVTVAVDHVVAIRTIAFKIETHPVHARVLDAGHIDLPLTFRDRHELGMLAGDVAFGPGFGPIEGDFHRRKALAFGSIEHIQHGIGDTGAVIALVLVMTQVVFEPHFPQARRYVGYMGIMAFIHGTCTLV